MTCPLCGSEMNHQADKLVHPQTRAEAERMTPGIDGVIEEIYACPSCGRIDSRRLSPDEGGNP